MIGWTATSTGAENVVVEVRDLWNKKTLGQFTGGYNATIDARDVQMLRVKKV